MSQQNLTKVFAVCVLIFIFQTSFFAAADRHKFHTSLTRMDFNADKKIVEISIQLFPHDLVPTLEKRSGKQIELETTPNVDKFILDYLTQNFILKDKNGEIKKIEWVGKELEVDTAYIYIQIPLEEGLQGSSLQNTLFFESFPEQTNLVMSRFEKKKADLLFIVGDKFKQISFTAQENEQQ